MKPHEFFDQKSSQERLAFTAYPYPVDDLATCCPFSDRSHDFSLDGKIVEKSWPARRKTFYKLL
jgi:hypothetical protein